jgi:acetyl esterase/lipase
MAPESTGRRRRIASWAMPAPTIDPEVAALLGAIGPMLAELNPTTLPTVRQQRLTMLEGMPLSDQVKREDITVPGPENAPDIILRVHIPVALQTPAACVYSIHGGGYILGDRSMDDMRFDRWCPKFGMVGVSVEYRLSPETPYPGPLEDCYAGLRWVFDHAGELGIDRARIGISGASAGGGLAAALALLARDRDEIRPAFQLLAYPMIDDRQITPSSGWEVPIWTPANNAFGWRSYLGPLYGGDSVPSHAAPSRAEDLSGLPPALVYVGTLDGFCDEDVLYATRMYQAGVPAELHVYPGAPHGFDGFAPTSSVSRRAVRAIEEWLAGAVGAPSG